MGKYQNITNTKAYGFFFFFRKGKTTQYYSE